MSSAEAEEAPRWYAAGGHVIRCGPFLTQRDAWEALRLAPELRKGSPYPANARVWPEWDDDDDVGAEECD